MLVEDGLPSDEGRGREGVGLSVDVAINGSWRGSVAKSWFCGAELNLPQLLGLAGWIYNASDSGWSWLFVS